MDDSERATKYPYETLQNHLQCMSEWNCEVLCKGICITSPSSVMTYNICDFLRPITTDIKPQEASIAGSNPLYSQMKPFLDVSSNFQFDPSKFKGVEHRASIKSYIVQKCREAGFECDYHTQIIRDLPHHHHANSKSCKILFYCAHNKKSYAASNKEKKNAERPGAQSRRPIDDKDRCPFQFEVFCKKDDSLWYLSICKRGEIHNSGLHRGHFKQVSALVSNIDSSDIDDKIIDLAISMHKKGVDFTKIADILNENYMKKGDMNGLHPSSISPSQIRHLVTNRMTDSICTNFSSAEHLLYTFDSIKSNDQDFNYVALIHTSDEGYKLKLPVGRPRKIHEDDIPIDLIRKSMKIKDNEDVLLAVSWVSASEIHLLTKFPSIIVVDVTEKTNREKRGLFVATGLDGNNKIFPALHSFMPNSKMNSFAWIYNHAIKELWPKDCIEKCEVMITDGEHALYAPIENMIRMRTHWKNLHLYRCTWHLFTQQWEKIPYKHLSKEGQDVFHTTNKWINTWITTIEKVHQFLDSFGKLKEYLKKNKALLGSTYTHIETILDSMESTSTYWAKCFRSNNLDLEQTTSSIAESMNGSLKRFSSKPLAHNSIANSAALMVAHSNKLLGKRQRLNEVCLAKTRRFEFASMQLNHVTTRCQKDIQDMIKASEHYKNVRMNKTRWYVWHENTFKLNNHEDDCVPRYSNVYSVEMNETFDECWCSEFCKVVSRKGIPCVHILAVVRQFHPKMVHPRWLKVYNSSLYDKCSHIFDDMLKWRIDNKSKVCVQGVIPDTLKIYDETNMNDTNVDDIKRLLSAVIRMDNQKKVLLRGESIPDEFLDGKIENDILDTDSSDPSIVLNNKVQRPEEDESTTHVTIKDSYNMRWSYLNSFIKDLDKLVSGDPKSWPSVVTDLDRVIANQVERRRACEKTSTQTSRQLVSSQLSIETSPNRRRYKSFSERFKR